MNEENETIQIIDGQVYYIYDDGTVIANGSATTMTQFAMRARKQRRHVPPSANAWQWGGANSPNKR